MAVRNYTLAVDWSGAGTYTGTQEDVTRRVLDDPVLKVTYGRDIIRGGAPMAAGKLSMALNNTDRILSPENTSSPIAGLVEEGRPVRLTLSGIALFDGALDEFDLTDTGAKRFTADCVDLWGRLAAQPLSTPVYDSIRTGTAIGLLLDAVGWAGARDLDPGATVIPWWWLEDTDAASALEDLIASEGHPAAAYIENGTFVFRDRHHRILRTQSTTVQATYAVAKPAGTRPTALKVLRGAGYDRGMKDIVNAATIAVEVRAPSPPAQVWSTDETFTIDSGQVLELDAQPSDPFLAATTPEAVTDYTVQSGTVTVWLSRDSGQSATIFVRADGGPAVVVGMAMRATPLAVARTVKVTAEDTASIPRRGRKSWPGTAKWASPADAQVVADRVVAIYASNRPTITISIAYVPNTPNAASYLTQVTGRRIGDRIRYANDELGIDDEFWVERIEHEIVKLGALHRLTLGCQLAGPDQPSNVLTFDVAGRGFNDGLFGITGIDSAANVLTFGGGSGHRFNEGVFAS